MPDDLPWDARARASPRATSARCTPAPADWDPVSQSPRPVRPLRRRGDARRPRRPLAVHQLPRLTVARSELTSSWTIRRCANPDVSLGPRLVDVQSPSMRNRGAACLLSYVGQAPHTSRLPARPAATAGASCFFRPLLAPTRPRTSRTQETTTCLPQPVTPKKMPFEKYQRFVPIVLHDRTWPNMVHRAGAAVVQRRPARRQPGADRPDGPAAQAAHVRRAGEDGLQGDRGRLPRRPASPTSTSSAS